MECSQHGYVTFLMCCNVALMLVGVCVLVLGVKMEQLLSALLLLSVPLVGRAVKGVIATGALISVAGITGMVGACNEAPLLLRVHLFALVVIVMVEFGIGVTLLVVRRTIENYLGSLECNTNCATTLDALVLDYALPSAGLMLTIIIVEAVMMYSALKVLSHLRDRPKIVVEPAEHDVQMHSVASPFPRFSPRLDRTFLASPHSSYPPLDSPFFAAPSPQQWFTPERDFTQQHPSPYVLSPRLQPQAMKSPHYAAMHLPPPSYQEAVPEVAVGSRLVPPPTPLKRERSSSCNSV